MLVKESSNKMSGENSAGAGAGKSAGFRFEVSGGTENNRQRYLVEEIFNQNDISYAS